MAISISEFIGYAQFYKGNSQLFRLPVFKATGTPPNYGDTAEFKTDLNIFDVEYTTLDIINSFSTLT